MLSGCGWIEHTLYRIMRLWLNLFRSYLKKLAPLSFSNLVQLNQEQILFRKVLHVFESQKSQHHAIRFSSMLLYQLALQSVFVIRHQVCAMQMLIEYVKCSWQLLGSLPQIVDQLMYCNILHILLALTSFMDCF